MVSGCSPAGCSVISSGLPTLAMLAPFRRGIPAREPPILNALAAASDFSQQRSETRSLPILYSHSSGKNFKQKTSSKNYSCPHFRGGDPRWLQ